VWAAAAAIIGLLLSAAIYRSRLSPFSISLASPNKNYAE
jgi:hypothetical protein